MKLISFSLTTKQIRNRSKTVTRRLGWKDLKPGTLLQACEKCMGRKPGEPLVRLAVIRVKSVRREPLNYLSIGEVVANNTILKEHFGRHACTRSEARDEVNSEGFPLLTPAEFVEMFCREMKCKPDTLVTRIEFEYATSPILK